MVSGLSERTELPIGTCLIQHFSVETISSCDFAAIPAESLPGIFQAAGMPDVGQYRYWDAGRRGVCVDALLEDLERVPERSVVVLSASAHWPTGADLSREHWVLIAQLMMVRGKTRKEKKVVHSIGIRCWYLAELLCYDHFFPVFHRLSHQSSFCSFSFTPPPTLLQRRQLFPFLLLPAQGLCSGDLERDAWPVQYCQSLGMELLCAQSFSHCFGLYGERERVRERGGREGERGRERGRKREREREWWPEVKAERWSMAERLIQYGRPLCTAALPQAASLLEGRECCNAFDQMHKSHDYMKD